MDRAERRHKAEVKSKKRLKHQVNQYMDSKDVGYLRKTHNGCGCWMCKPWKHDFWEDDLKPSEKRKIQNHGEDDL